MLKLFGKDFLACRRPWLLMLLVFTLYAASPMGWESLPYMLMGAALVVGGLVINAVLEDKHKTEGFYLSLPVSRAEVVAAKYLTAGLLAAACGVIVFLGILILARVVPPDRFGMDPRIMVSIDGAGGYVFVVAVLVAFFLPFYLGFGLGRGGALFSATILGINLVLYALHRIHTSIRPRWSTDFQINTDQDIGAVLIGLISSLRSVVGTPLFVVLVVLAAGVPVLFSIGISMRLYDHREF
jgi:hypothetical protein